MHSTNSRVAELTREDGEWYLKQADAMKAVKLTANDIAALASQFAIAKRMINE